MERRRILPALASVTILFWLLTALLVMPSYAADETGLTLNPDQGRIGDLIELDGYGFAADTQLYIYFSNDKSSVGDNVEIKVTTYEGMGLASIDKKGNFSSPHSFKIPDELNDGKDSEKVWNGTYYIYVTYRGDKYIIASTKFTITSGEIEIDPEEGTVGSEISISGEEMRPSQEITIKYEGEEVDITTGDTNTDSNGRFLSTIIIPESTAGSHTITAIDESGNKPETEFKVEPSIILDTASQAIDKTVKISGSGFAYRSNITITLDDNRITTTPISLHTNHYGSFAVSITVPYYSPYVGGKPSKVTARDDSDNYAEAGLTILSAPPEITLDPVTSLTSPGYVGMELTVNGIRFTPGSNITITYNGSGSHNTATTTADDSGTFSVTFTVPPCAAGSYTVTVADSTNSLTSPFTMESKPPSTPTPLLPAVTTVAPARTRFDWQEVTDSSGVTYLLQIGADSNFSTILLEKEGLTGSEYTLTGEEELKPTGQDIAYYWRVKAIDGAFNESEWSTATSFYIGFSWTAIPAWAIYVWAGLGILLLLFPLGFWIWKNAPHS